MHTVNKFFLSLILLLTATTAAVGATISGTVSDENGQPLAQSVLCLSLQNTAPSAAPACLQKQTSSATGSYTFNQVAAGAYVVTIVDGRFPTFTWLPVARKLTIATFADQVTGFSFKKQFSFSNFKKAVAINGSDLPELSGFNLSQDIVFVKVYAVDPANPSVQTVFFMGRVTDAKLKFRASAPWTVNEVIYEIFSATAARQGSLILPS